MINGVVISTNNLYKELKSMGHDVRILALSESGKERIEDDIYYLHSVSARVYPSAKIKKPFRNGLVKSIISWEPDIIHSQTEFSTMLVARHISRKLQIPHIHTYHTMYEDYLKYLFKGKLLKPRASGMITGFILNRIDGVIAPTKKVKDALARYGVKTETYVVPTGIDIKKFRTPIEPVEKSQLLNKYGLSERDNVILYIGRVAYEKNIDELIDKFFDLSEKIDNLKFLIVGGGPYLENLREKVDTLSMRDRILFTGMIDNKEIYKYYKLGKVFVTASTSESQGLTYIEALASGLPVVCKYDKAIDGLISSDNGAVYNDDIEFEEAMLKLLTDEVHRLKISKNAVQSTDDYSTTKFAQNIEDVYNKTVIKINDSKLSRSEPAV